MSRRRVMLQDKVFVENRRRQLAVSTAAGCFFESGYRNTLPLSVELMLNVTELSDLQTVFWEIAEDGFGMTVSLNADGTLGIRYNNAVIVYGRAVSVGVHHIVVSISAGAASSYMDGVPMTSVEDEQFAEKYVTQFLFGCLQFSDAPRYNFRGEFMLMRRYDCALTDEQVSTLYNGGTPDETVLPSALRAHCTAEYLPQNLVEVDGAVVSWLDSSEQAAECPLPMSGSTGGRDLSAYATPEIVRASRIWDFDLMLDKADDAKYLWYIRVLFESTQTDATAERRDGRIFCNNGSGGTLNNGRPRFWTSNPIFTLGKKYKFRVKWTNISGTNKLTSYLRWDTATLAAVENNYTRGLGSQYFESPVLECQNSTAYYRTFNFYFGQGEVDSEFSLDKLQIIEYE